MRRPRPRRPALLLRTAFLLIFLLFLVYATFFAKWRPHDLAGIQHSLDAVGPSAPFAAVALQALGVVLLIPGFLLVLATAFLFGLDAIWISLAGQTLGALGAHLIARHVGRDPLHAVLGQHLIALERTLRHARFRTLLLLRLASFVPGPLLVYAPGLVGVPLRDNLAAAAVGQVPFVVALVLLGDSLARVRSPEEVVQPDFLLLLLAVLALIVLPVAAVTLYRRRGGRVR